jgi:pimeloyl-ACP methyl ester carboxylesterase
VVEALTFVTARPEALAAEVWEHATEIAALRRTQPWATSALVEGMSSIAPYVLTKGRFSDLIHKVTQPTLVIHGTEDRLVHVAAARWIGRQRPDWTVAIFQGVGHVPMLEAPERVLEVFTTWEATILPSDATR